MKEGIVWDAVVAEHGATRVAVGMVSVRALLDAFPMGPNECPSAYQERVDAREVRHLIRRWQRSEDFFAPTIELTLAALTSAVGSSALQKVALTPSTVAIGTSLVEALRRAAATNRAVEFWQVPVCARSKAGARTGSPSASTVTVWTDHTVDRLAVLAGMVTREQTALARRSRYLFTYSAWLGAHRELAPSLARLPANTAADVALAWWTAVAEQVPQWHAVQAGELASSSVRAEFVHCHAAMLQAIGMLGNALLAEPDSQWRERVRRLSTVDFSRENPAWSGNVVIGGKVSKHRQSVKIAFGKLLAICQRGLDADL